MGKEQPTKLYFLITFLLIIIAVYFSLMLKNFLSEKTPNRDIVEKENIHKELPPEEIRQSRTIFTTATIIFLTLIVIFIMFKFIMFKTASRNK